jgi:hypothetical protein
MQPQGVWVIGRGLQLGIPAILAHTGAIAPGNCGLSIAASVVFYGFVIALEYFVAAGQ